MFLNKASQSARKFRVEMNLSFQQIPAWSEKIITNVPLSRGSTCFSKLNRLCGNVCFIDRGPVCQLFDGTAIMIACLEIHLGIDASWVTLQNLFENARRFKK